MRYDAIIIGAGLSGLASAALLAKRGLKTAVVEQAFKPGGSCGIFKRQGAIFDQGSAMLYGFGEKGFNAHRFIYNVLEEPIDVIKHKSLYSVYFKGTRIEFHYNIGQFIEELSKVFPDENKNLKRFYRDMEKLYDKVIAGDPVFSTPDELDKKKSLKQVLKHPVSYIKFLSLMNKSTKALLNKYFKNEDIFNFFNKLTSTYCYTNVEETPAILSAIMFVDNHRGGSFYPAGSTIHVPGILEKVIEENGGEMFYETAVQQILIENNHAKGVKLKDGRTLFADAVVYSGTVWNLYGKMIDPALVPEEKKQWAANLKASYPSVVLYALVKKEVIPKNTSPITLFTENEEEIDENEVTAYIFSIDDPAICPKEYHTVMAIGPTFKDWPAFSEEYCDLENYRDMKQRELDRLLSVMEKHFPGFKDAAVHKEVSTPLSIERYTMKNNGSVAGPLQSMGQHMLKRLHIRSGYEGLYCCGESTVMGTGTPTVTVSGITAANAILRGKGLQPFLYSKDIKNYVREHAPLYRDDKEEKSDLQLLKEKASHCAYCEHPACMEACPLDIRGINRRLTAGNFPGACKILNKNAADDEQIEKAQYQCVLNAEETVVEIANIIAMLKKL